MEINFDETIAFVDSKIAEHVKKERVDKMKRKVDELVYMRLEEDEIQACVQMVEKMREEKRLAAKRKKAENTLKNAAFDMVEVSDVATTKHFLRELMRLISPLE